MLMNVVLKTFSATVLLVCATRASSQEETFYGLLRARDVTPFGSLRLDMRPGHTVAIERGTFALELEVAYQNTWALSPEVENYLIEREPLGRRELGPDDVRAIRDLPGENYLLDVETATVDLTTHYKFSDAMSAYLIVSAITYQGGFLDSTIESFHDSFGFSSFGRPAASRSDVNLVYDLNSSQTTFLETPTSGGFADPTLGVRYTGLALSETWMLGFEGAIKVPLAGRRTLLSTGRTDYGVQATLQRRENRHALYANVAAVYYAGALDPAPQESQILPTLILGYEFGWTPRTNLNLQAYASKSTYTERTTQLEELNGNKYQLTVGFRHMRNDVLWSFAITENVQNVNNTPDIGVQFGIAFIPQPSPAR
jgi:hypothetical protein